MAKYGRVSAYYAAINCTNSRKLCPDIQFYRFPLETPVSRQKLHDFIHSFSHTNNKHTCDLCRSTLVDDDSYDDRRILLSFKAYDSDASYGG